MVSEELWVALTESDIRIELRKKVKGNKIYEEAIVMELANSIVSERLERENLKKRRKC